MIRAILTGVTCLWAATASASVDIQEVTTEAGFNAWLVEEPSIPFVSLELRFIGGGSLDPEGKRGVTNLMAGLLEEGAGDLDAQAFAEAKEALAATLQYDAGDDAMAVSAKVLTENREEAMALLRTSLLEPRFDEEAIARVKAQVLSSIQSDRTDPDLLVGQRAAEILYGDHPYGSAMKGTVESVEALTRADIVDAWQAALATDRVYIGAAGDISAEELSELIDGLLEGLPETGPPLPEPVTVSTEAETVVVPFDTPQSVALFGHRAIPRDDPDFFAAFVMNQILGAGGFESRLMEEVRDKRGLTYGVYSYIANREYSDMIMGRVASATDRIAEAVEVIRNEWRRMAEEGVTAEELEAAKTFLTGAYPLRFDSNGAIANILVGMQTMGLEPGYIATRNDRVNAVTLEDVRRVAKRVLLPEELLFVVVGQPEGLADATVLEEAALQ